MNGRVLPNNLEAEQSVLGACFLSKYALVPRPTAAAALNPAEIGINALTPLKSRRKFDSRIIL